VSNKVNAVLTVAYLLRLVSMNWNLDVAATFFFGMFGGLLIAFWLITAMKARVVNPRG